MSKTLPVDTDELRDQVREKYREVAVAPSATYHFHTGRTNAAHCGYDAAIVDALPDCAVESFAGVANPFAGATGEEKARAYEVYGYSFLARKPDARDAGV